MNISNVTRKEIIISEFREILKKKMPYITTERADELAIDSFARMAAAAETAGIKTEETILNYIEAALDKGDELIAGEIL